MKLNKMKTKKLKSYITIKQRITAAFMVVVLLLQICIPTVALAATAWGSQAEFNRQLQMQLNSGLFSAVELAEANEAYKAAFYVYQDAQKADNLLDFYRSYNCVTGSPVIKQIGDTFVQTRLIRSQIKALMGRFLIQESIAPLTVYEAEAERINSLYKSGIAYGKKTCDDKLPMGSPLAENTSVAVDMIWPEVRTVTINNVAVSVLVPVVYLSQATLDRRVDGHQINFLGDTTFAGITLNSGVLLNGYNNTITGINGIINNGGKIASGGDLTLFSSGTIANLGGVFSATDNLKIVAEDFYNKTLVIPYKDKNGEGTRIGEIARVEAEEENLYIYANNDITFEGAGGYAGNQLLLKAGNNINIVPKQTNGNNQSQEGHWKVNKSTTDLLMSRLAAEDTLSLIAGGLINITASELISTQGGIELLAGQGIHILDELEQTSIQKEDRKGKTTGTSSEFRTEAVRAILKAGKGVLLDSEHGDVVLRATQLTSASGAEVYAKNGKVHLLMTKELEEFHLQTVRKSTWTIKTRTEDIIHENNIQNAIVGGLQVQAMYGINVEYTGKEGATLKEQIEEYRKMPEMKWMADLYDQAVVSGGQNVNWEVMEEVHKELKKTKKNLSPAAMAIIAIAVAVVTGGAGLGMAGAIQAAVVNATVGTLGATAAAALGAAMAAGAVALTTQAAQSLAAGNNLSETLSAMDSNESLKSLAVAMATAGAMSATKLDMFKVPEGSPVNMVNLARQAGQALVNSAVSVGVSVAINGGNSDDYLNALKQSLATFAINTIGQKLANNIATADSVNKATQYISNAALGCLTEGLTAKLSAQDAKDACASGAGGGVIAVGLADILEQKTKALINKTVSEQQVTESSAQLSATLSFLSTNRVDISRLLAGMIAFAAHGDVNAATNGAGIIGVAQEMRIMRTVTLGQTLNAMGMANCGDMTLDQCSTQAAVNVFRKALIEQGKHLEQDIDAKINYLKNHTTFFDDMGAYNAALLETQDSLEGLTRASRSYRDPAMPVIDPNGIEEVLVTGDKWSIMRSSLYGIGEIIGIAADTTDAIVQDGVKALLEKPYGAPLRWGFSKIAEAAQKYPEVAAVLNKPEELKEALGTGSASVLQGDKYAATKQFIDSEAATLPVYDKDYHESISHVASGYTWLIGLVGAGALVYAAKAMSFTRVAPDGEKFNNGEEDFYKNENALEFTSVSRIQLRNFLAKNTIPLIPGWDADRLYDDVLAVPKELRPEPEDYLPAWYIADHLNAFDAGVVRVTKTEFAKVDKSGTLSLPGETYVMTITEWNKAKQLANGDHVKLAELLKLDSPKTFFANKADVYAALVKPGDYLPLKVPTGREVGANIDWIPGLLTGGGFKEAVTTFGPDAAKNSDRLSF